MLAVGDDALGFWAALREVLPQTREQRCWVRKIARVLDALPKSLQPKAKAALHETMNAENGEAAETAVDRFQETYAAKYPKAPRSCSRPAGPLRPPGRALDPPP